MREGLPRIFGDYALLDPLGHGATGDVFLARPLDPDRGIPTPVVIKRLHPKYREQQEFIRRFRHEAEIATLVDSPHVAKVYAVGSAGESLFITMEFVPGFPVSHLLAELIEKNLNASIGVSAELMIGALSGLHALHTATDAAGRPLEVVHRDISPKNLMAGIDGRLHLIDLGLGKSKAQDWETEKGTIMGSPGYMAPEQIRGLAVDSRADVYAMGVVLFEMLTLRRFVKREANIADMMVKALTQPFTPPSQIRGGVSEALDRVVARAVAKKQDDRFQSAKDLADALRDAVPERVSQDQMRLFMQRAFGDALEHQAKVIEYLLSIPIPDEEPHEETAIFALHPTVHRMAAPVIVRPVGEKSMISEVPTIPSARVRPASLMQSVVESLTPVFDDEITSPEEKSQTAPTRLAQTIETPAPTPAPPSVGLPKKKKKTPLLGLVAVVSIALTLGLSLGILVVQSHEEPTIVPVVDQTAVSEAPHVVPVSPPKEEPKEEEPSPSPKPHVRALRTLSTPAKEPAKPEPPTQDEAASLSERTKSMEDRVKALQQRVNSDDPRSEAVHRLFLDLSLVRAELARKNNDPRRAIEQLSALESKLAQLEASN